MKKQTKDILDAELRNERKITFIGIFCALLLGLAFIFIDIPIHSSQVYGITKSLSTFETDEGSKLVIGVQLNSGINVVAGFPRNKQFQENATVELNERRNIFGQKVFSFEKYVESIHNNSLTKSTSE